MARQIDGYFASYASAIIFYEKALQSCDRKTYCYILPRITSCYRKNHMPRKAIEVLSNAKRVYGVYIITSALITSAAAAYCDLKEYENALKCCRWAMKTFGGHIDSNMRRVMFRIKKESNLI